MSEYTPGPWEVVELVDGYDIRSPESRCRIATASDPEAIWGAIGREEDACLIAAAPNLLSALEEVFTVMNDDMPVGLRKVCYEAIAKAKGE